MQTAFNPGNIHFLQTVKCPVIGKDIGVPVGTMVCNRKRTIIPNETKD